MFQSSLGIVVRSTDYKDYDRILTIFTKEFGKITAGVRVLLLELRHIQVKDALQRQPGGSCEQLFQYQE